MMKKIMLKFTNWALVGAVAIVVLFDTNNLSGQAEPDTLYNPFPLSNAAVPYRPISCVRGLPERLKPEEAMAAIWQAFEDSGISLRENVWFEKENIGVYLSGYSEKEEIGFLFLDYTNMDHTFTTSGPHSKVWGTTNRWEVDSRVEAYLDSENRMFAEFLENKNDYVALWGSRTNDKARNKFAEQLAGLPARGDMEVSFHQYRLQYELASFREGTRKLTGFKKKVLNHIEDRFDDSLKKLILFKSNHQLNLLRNQPTEFVAAVATVFEAQKQVEEDNVFGRQLLLLNKFVGYHSGEMSLLKDRGYQALKMKIMQAYPIDEWFDNLGELDEYRNRSFVSLSDAQIIDHNNQKGTQFIALIGMKDSVMSIPGSRSPTRSSPELEEEEFALMNEYRLKSGITQEVIGLKMAELSVIGAKYKLSVLRRLPTPQRDSLMERRRDVMEAFEEKYEAMNRLTAEGKVMFEQKFNDLGRRKLAWHKANRELLRQQTIVRLTEQVQRYIKWAKYKMGK